MPALLAYERFYDQAMTGAFSIKEMNCKAVVVSALVVTVGVAFLAYRMYRHDMVTLETFAASYERFNTAIAKGNEGETKGALARLHSIANERISSLTKNDRTAMRTMREIADIAQEECDAHAAGKNSSPLTQKRKDAYVRFETLGKD